MNPTIAKHSNSSALSRRGLAIVLGVALTTSLLHVASSGHYGYSIDELYYLASQRLRQGSRHFSLPGREAGARQASAVLRRPVWLARDGGGRGAGV